MPTKTASFICSYLAMNLESVLEHKVGQTFISIAVYSFQPYIDVWKIV